jgi:hypothetical protein
MNLDEAIEALTKARAEVGGDAPLLMADGLHVVSFQTGDDGAVYVCDLPQPGDEEDDFQLLPDPKGRSPEERTWIKGQILDAVRRQMSPADGN